MIADKEIIYWVWLSQVLGAGNKDTEYILSKVSSPKELYNFGQKNGFENIKFLPEYFINKMKNIKIDVAESIIEKCNKNNYEIITINDKIYPNKLKNIYSSPLLFYLSGNINNIKNIDDILSIAIVGTRKCSDYAKEVTTIFSKQLSSVGITIISGMAVGIDTKALKEALNNKRRVIAVLGCGLDVDYPIQNIELKKQIENSENGCLISEYPPETRPFSSHFPVRNRIMSALSNGVLFVEAGIKSGALITAKIAIEQGKDVYGVPSNIFFKNNLGTLNLLKEGAILVTDPDDIIFQYRHLINIKDKINEDNESQIFNYEISNLSDISAFNSEIKESKTIDKSEKEEYNVDYNLDGILNDIYILLKNNGPQSADYISEKLSIPINEILANITQLELIGAIKNYNGMKYSIN